MRRIQDQGRSESVAAMKQHVYSFDDINALERLKDGLWEWLESHVEYQDSGSHDDATLSLVAVVLRAQKGDDE